jgi:hypothetical protein
MQPNQGIGFVVLILGLIAVGLTCLFVVSEATRRLGRHPDLLVPLGLFFTAEGLLGLLLTIPIISAVFSPAWNLNVLAIGASLSLNFLVRVALAVAYAGWTTALIVQAVRQDRVDLLEVPFGLPKWFLRALGAEMIGWCTLFAVLIPAITLGAVILPLTLLLIAAFSLFWNLLSAGLLLVVMTERESFVDAVRSGLRIGWTRMGRWWFPVVIQMVLLGWLTVIYVSYTSNPQPGSYTTNTKSDVSINAFWTGGYENSSRWHTKLMAAVETEPLPLVEFLLGGVFGILAIVIKLRIATDLYGPPMAATDPH